MRVKRVILVNVAFIGMTLWLLNRVREQDLDRLPGLGCLMIAAVHSNFGRRHIRWIKVMAPSIFLLYLVLTVGFGMGGTVVAGRRWIRRHVR